MRRALLTRQSGISLIEALVALAVMAFGMLGVVGLQATMRQNVDVSKQRAEAVRIAQESIETARAFSLLQTPEDEESVLRAYETLADRESPNTGYTTNTVYSVSRTVSETGATVNESSDARMKALEVTVSWTDRLGQPQKVRLGTTIAGVSPDVAGSLGIPSVHSSVTRQPLGRNVNIPLSAVDASDKRSSSFAPTTGVTWVFNNQSGVITSICSPIDTCTPANALLLSGYVRFAAAATSAEAEAPTGTAISVDLQVTTTAPAAATVACYSRTVSTHVAYYCAVPVDPESTPALKWSGRLNLVSSVALPIASLATETSAASFRVCRYTPTQSDTPTNGNIGHPLNYTHVDGPLSNQNFLVIRAGDGSTANECPGDDAGTAFINGNTWQHQPHL
ncbi:MAG: prepilin-type N-terminal cleavage/methylation domain-containing protein [Burkholderiaceae bacterium]|nr:prepilin-type N-terminal cleavage/methylation domain-containing protein [Burkholderiaceae bacterium]